VSKTTLRNCENIIRTCSIGTTVDESQIKGILKKLGIRASKRLGQHFLLDEDIASRQVSLAEPLGEDTVLEVGPGLGILTAPLLKRSNEMIAVEKDKRLCSFLRERFPRLNLIEGDALEVELQSFDKVVSNLPYEISSPITFMLLDFGFRKGVLMYQTEFAERLVSTQGQKGYSRLCVVVSYRASARIIETVPKEKFFPIPKVDSAIVELIPRKAPFHVESEERFLTLVDVLFRHRRKKIGNSILLSWESFFGTEDEARSYLREAEWSDKRVEELTPAQIAGISNEIAAKD
jgi:16S rRNA (adenine1518-N6/adenine1519-N6)-dimethyltransferase